MERRPKRSAATTEHREATRARLEEALAPYDGAFVAQTSDPIIDLREAARRQRPLRVSRPIDTQV